MSLTPTMAVHWKQNPRPEEEISFIHEILPVERTLPRPGDGFHTPHKQNYFELIFFCAGIRDIKINDKVYVLSAGDILAIRPGEAHCGRSHACILDRYYLHIGQNAFDAFGGSHAFLLQIFGDNHRQRQPVLHCPAEVQAQIFHLLEKTDFALRFHGEAIGGIEAFAYILQILALLQQAHGATDAGPPGLLLKILAYMETSLAVQNIWDEIYRAFGISRVSLWRIFKANMQTTPAKYLQTLRLEHARLLLEAGADVTGACIESGFNDCSHFIRCFREKYGSTPLRYQKQRTIVKP